MRVWIFWTTLLCLTSGPALGLDPRYTMTPTSACIRNVIASLTEFKEVRMLKNSVDTDSVRRTYLRLLLNPQHILSPKEADAIKAAGLERGIKSFRVTTTGKKKFRTLLVALQNLSPKYKDQNKKVRVLVDSILLNSETPISKKESHLIVTSLGITVDELRQMAKLFGPSLKSILHLSKISSRLGLAMITGGLGLALLEEQAVLPEEMAKREQLKDDEFEIIYLSPAPHTDIRVGDTVYSYGPGYVSKSSYWKWKEVNDNFLFGNSRRVRFKLNATEISSLRTYLEGEVGKVYLWGPTTYLCVAAAHRAIKQHTSVVIPPGLDRSPALSEDWFKLSKMLGNKKISEVLFFSKGNLVFNKATDVASQALDLSIFTPLLLESALASQVDRLPNSVRVVPKSDRE